MGSGIRSARRLVPSEAQVKKAVCDWLDARRIRYHRLNFTDPELNIEPDLTNTI